MPDPNSFEASKSSTKVSAKPGWHRYVFKPAAFAVVLLAGLFVGWYVQPTWVVQERVLDTQISEAGQVFVVERGQPVDLDDAVPIAETVVSDTVLSALPLNDQADATTTQRVFVDQPDGSVRYFELRATRHWGVWSLLPAGAAIGLCLLTREPITSLFGGVVAGALLLQLYDLPGEVLMPTVNGGLKT